MGAGMQEVKWAARAHCSLAVAFRGAPVKKQFTLRDCLSQSLAYRSDPEGTAEEIILPRAVEANGFVQRTDS
jgi:hypothetical protein